jgi:hypothetical protein
MTRSTLTAKSTGPETKKPETVRAPITSRDLLEQADIVADYIEALGEMDDLSPEAFTPMTERVLFRGLQSAWIDFMAHVRDAAGQLDGGAR